MTHRGARIDPEKCTGCGKCYDNCPGEAIEEVPADGAGDQGKGRA
jgi:NAD-dependent dihydropyrimidine dehydrogenase PreA subunit